VAADDETAQAVLQDMNALCGLGDDEGDQDQEHDQDQEKMGVRGCAIHQVILGRLDDERARDARRLAERIGAEQERVALRMRDEWCAASRGRENEWGLEYGVSMEDVCAVICQAFQLDADQLQAQTRRAAVVWPRQVAMYLGVRQGRLSVSEVGRYFGRNHGTVSHALQAVADRMYVEPHTRDFIGRLGGRLNRKSQI
jgi:chromosomal replication initiation ATPase DnaA